MSSSVKNVHIFLPISLVLYYFEINTQHTVKLARTFICFNHWTHPACIWDKPLKHETEGIVKTDIKLSDS